MFKDEKRKKMKKEFSEKLISNNEGIELETSVSEANSLINEEFYHENRHQEGISPALLLVNAPLVDTDDQYVTNKRK